MLNQADLEYQVQYLLLTSGLVSKLKAEKVYIWSINHFPGRVTFSVDVSKNPRVKIQDIQKQIQAVLAELPLKIDAYKLSMDELCCYRGCKGCLNGDADTQALWILDE